MLPSPLLHPVFPLCSKQLKFLQQPVSAGIDRSHKAAPLPEGIDEMKDGTGSGGGSQNLAGRDNPGTTGGGSGQGGKDEPYVDRAAEDLTERN